MFRLRPRIEGKIACDRWRQEAEAACYASLHEHDAFVRRVGGKREDGGLRRSLEPLRIVAELFEEEGQEVLQLGVAALGFFRNVCSELPYYELLVVLGDAQGDVDSLTLDGSLIRLVRPQLVLFDDLVLCEMRDCRRRRWCASAVRRRRYGL